MIPACAGPVSWLALERHALGELDAARAAEVAAHLDGCAACRAAYGAIEADRRALPPLPDLALAAAARRRRARRAVAAAATALAAAAALLLVWRDREGQLDRVKGDELTLSLVRERAGDIEHDPAGFRPGDRFKVLVTCADPRPLRIDMTVRQGGAVDRPLGAAEIRCGNRVPLPGAFRLTGSGAATICVAAGGVTDCSELAAE
ncbi:MAG TPA: zf-HC2 domain-containing protein [Kofleriaceae bacterium]|nr:zf-HC2 domain-containing protein [Kofleriaceae bacterium]